jgi:hypothetical protein
MTPAEEAEQLFLNKAWPEVNSILLVNFLRMPEEHKKHLLESMRERRPDLFGERYWKMRCKFAEKYLASVPIDQAGWDASSAQHHKDEYILFIKNHTEI